MVSAPGLLFCDVTGSERSHCDCEVGSGCRSWQAALRKPSQQLSRREMKAFVADGDASMRLFRKGQPLLIFEAESSRAEYILLGV